MTTQAGTTYPLRLPASLKDAVERLSEQNGTSVDQFVTAAVAEKVAAMSAEPAESAEEFFARRRAGADREAFRRIMNRQGGEPPRPGDELPPD